MRTRHRRSLLGIPAILAALMLALALPTSAPASHSQQTVLQDDQQLIYSPPSHVAQTLQKLKNMGVDRVRTSVVWSLLAPDPLSSKRPRRFNATNPAAYPTGAWFRYDFLDRVAHQLGRGVYFQPAAPAPYWATTPRRLPQGSRWSHDINAKALRPVRPGRGDALQRALCRARPERPAERATSRQLLGIYNEPNIGGWMTPQWDSVHGHKVEASPAIYRGMVDAAWSALVRTGHRRDTIGTGETAAYGAGHAGYGASIDPLTFVRAFYCLGSNYEPLAGTPATESAVASGRRAGLCAQTRPCSTPRAGPTIRTTSPIRRVSIAETPIRPPCRTCRGSSAHWTAPSAPTTGPQAFRSTSPSGVSRAAIRARSSGSAKPSRLRPTGAPRVATLHFQARGSNTWTNVAQVRSTNPEGFLTTHVCCRPPEGCD